MTLKGLVAYRRALDIFVNTYMASYPATISISSYATTMRSFYSSYYIEVFMFTAANVHIILLIRKLFDDYFYDLK